MKEEVGAALFLFERPASSLGYLSKICSGFLHLGNQVFVRVSGLVCRVQLVTVIHVQNQGQEINPGHEAQSKSCSMPKSFVCVDDQGA